MPETSKKRCIGILTSGGDRRGLNAAIRASTKPDINEYDIIAAFRAADDREALVESLKA